MDSGLRTTIQERTAAAALCGLLILAGCSRDIETIYGRKDGPGASLSINGTSVLGKMFEQAGHKVFSWDRLSPRLADRADCIVWFPDDFQPPSKEVRRWLDDWLDGGVGRTLIYVGRDFDAEPWYWEHVLPDAPDEQRERITRRLNSAKVDFDLARQKLPTSEDCEWFSIESKHDPRRVRAIQGVAEWLDGVDAAKTDITLRSRLIPATDSETLLRSDDDVLVSSHARDDGRVLVVANGSFLLNLPLVNHEHRKLAGKLIAEIGPPGQTVVFLESRAGGPSIRDKDPAASSLTGMEIFNLWPTNWVLMHLAAVGVIFCFARWPIFGRPKTCEPAGVSDFGRHVDAVAELLERSRDRPYAMSRILNYHQKTGAEKGTGPICRNGPEGAAHKLDLSPFPPPEQGKS